MPSPFRSEILSDKFYIFSVLLSLYDICSINGQTSCISVSQVTNILARMSITFACTSPLTL